MKENSTQDPAADTLMMETLLANTYNKGFWGDIFTVGSTMASTLLTKEAAVFLWQEMRDTMNENWRDFPRDFNVLLTEEEQDAVIAECQSPKRVRGDSVQNDVLSDQSGNTSWDERVWTPGAVPPTERMKIFDETSRWETHLHLLQEAGGWAIEHDRVNGIPNPDPQALLERMMNPSDEETLRWEAHVNVLHEAGVRAIATGKFNLVDMRLTHAL
jgi:hypothetical protein